MKMLELELYGCILLAFSAIEKVVYKPVNDVQIIIGSNGSGKSSLLNQCNPLPIDKRYMTNDGYKTYRCEHRGLEYTLHYTYGKHRKCSFIEHNPDKGDIELNEGGTTVAQKMLIERIFGLDHNLMNLWLGKTCFTKLAPIKRRDWILKLSGSDLDFAMTVYNRFKSEMNDAKSVERHYVKRLSDEMNEVVETHKVAELENEIASISATITSLMEQKDNSLPSINAVKLEIDNLLREFDRCAYTALDIKVNKPKEIPADIMTVVDLKYYLKSLVEKVKSIDSQLETVYQQRKTFDDAIFAMKENGVDDINGLEEKTIGLKEEIDALIQSTPIYNDFESLDANRLLGRYQSISGVLMDALMMLPNNSEGRFTEQLGAIAEGKANGFSERIAVNNRRRDSLLHTLKHYEDSQDVNCPECKHQFKPGLNGVDPDSLRKEIDDIALKITKDEELLKRCREYLEEYRDYVTAKECIIKIMTDNKVLQPLWQILWDKHIFDVAPLSLIGIIQQFEPYLENCVRIQSLIESVKLNETIMATINSTAGTELLSALDSQISSLISEKEQTNAIGKVAHVFYTKINKKGELIAQAEEVKTKLFDRMGTLVMSMINKDITDNLSEEQVKLAKVSTNLMNIQRHDAIINEISESKEQASHRLRVFNTLVKAISPTEGLISKYIQNFLDVFLEDVNIVIAEIWTSSLEVLTCAVDSSEVNCKFPLSVNEGFCVCDDISEASAGQIDIIDFAFRQTLALYLGLQDFPMYLDELAPTLDEQHRINLVRYLNELMESKQFEQMFMISHYASNHYAFGNSDIIMLDGRNILDKPVEYNRCIEISYNESIVPKAA